MNGKPEGKMFCVGGEMLHYYRASAKPAVGYEHCIGLCPYTSRRIGQDKPPHYSEALNMFSVYTCVIQKAF